VATSGCQLVRGGGFSPQSALLATFGRLFCGEGLQLRLREKTC